MLGRVEEPFVHWIAICGARTPREAGAHSQLLDSESGIVSVAAVQLRVFPFDEAPPPPTALPPSSDSVCDFSPLTHC